MSTATTRLPLAEARALAEEVAALLGQGCERIEIAGSIRRERPTVGDLEIVCIPRVIETIDLFGADTGEYVNVLDKQVGAELSKGTFGTRPDKNGRAAVGERYKRLTYRGVGLDLFSVLPPAQWGVILLIRTGSAEFSHHFVSHLPPGYRVQNGALWRDSVLLPTPEEEHVFAAVGRRWVPPTERER